MDQTQASGSVGARELLDCLKESLLLPTQEMNRVEIMALDAALDGPALAAALLKGRILTSYQLDAVCNRKYEELRIGNYEVLARLGAGGMGTVFKARHRRMKRIVALKVLSPNLAKDATLLQRFQREVEMIARFTHPNVVMAFDADEDERGPFLVMEFVDGQDLTTLVEKQGPMDVAAAVDTILQGARGLEYAHGQGIIHRDIKPANLLRDAAGMVKVTDLGLARFNSVGGEPGAGGITQAGGIVGTVDYMSPEQAVDSTSIDHRSDIYSLGATLHFLLTGQPPYQGQTMMATLLKHRDAPIPSLTAARQDVPASLDAVFRRMMAKAPADRYQTMTDVVQALTNSAAADSGLWLAPGENKVSQTETLVQPGSLPTAHCPQASLLKVVLVEPSRAQSAIIRKYLQDQGLQNVVALASGEDALKAVRGQTPDVVVCALHLADMTGVQLAEQIRTQCKAGAPGFVLISSEAESGEVGSLSKCGNAVLLHKPFGPEQLVEALRVVAARRPAIFTAKDRSRLRVLIVDDSAAARVHMRSVLTGLGLAQFVDAADGAQAVAVVAREPFDLIVTDYNMPYMDGRGLVGYLKQNPATASVPIIMVTTEQDPDKLEAVRQLGVTAICDKTFQPDAVRKILEELVRTS